MKIEVKIDKDCGEPKVIIITDKMTDEVSQLIKNASGEAPQIIAGFNNDKAALLEQDDIIHIYTANGKVFAVTNEDEYRLRLRLYELEDRLDKKMFARISNSEIINLKKVNSFDLSPAGTICVSLFGNRTTYVSRRYVSKIKKVLGI